MKLLCSHRKRRRSLLFNQAICHLLAALLLICINQSNFTWALDSGKYPRLIFLAPSEKNSDHVLNEQDGLSGQIAKGWLLKADTEHSFDVHILTREQYNSIEEVNAAYIFFTPEPRFCDLSQHLLETDELKRAKEVKQNLIYKLNIQVDKSRFYGNITRYKKDVQRRQRSASDQLSSAKSGPALNRRVSLFSSLSQATSQVNTTYMVAKVTIKLKHHSSGPYFACLHVSKKLASEEVKAGNVTSLRFVHQGDKNALNQIITSKDL